MSCIQYFFFFMGLDFFLLIFYIKIKRFKKINSLKYILIFLCLFNVRAIEKIIVKWKGCKKIKNYMNYEKILVLKSGNLIVLSNIL